MLCPALFQLLDDESLIVAHGTTPFRLYIRLAKERPLIYVEPQDVKAWAWAHRLNVRQGRTITHALDALVEHGYAREWARGSNNVRRVTFTVERIVPVSLAA